MNLTTYLETRGITENLYISKLEDGSEFTTPTQLRKFRQKVQKKNQTVSIFDLRKLGNLVFIYQDIAYVSNQLIVPNFVLTSEQFKVILNQYSKDDLDIKKFLSTGLIIIDINQTDTRQKHALLGVFVDKVNKIIACVDLNESKRKMNQSIEKVVYLDESYSDVDEEILIALLGDTYNPLVVFDNAEPLETDPLSEDLFVNPQEFVTESTDIQDLENNSDIDSAYDEEYDEPEYPSRYTDELIELDEEYAAYYD